MVNIPRSFLTMVARAIWDRVFISSGCTKRSFLQ